MDTEFEEMLILEVEGYQCLYSKKHPDYKNRLIKNQAWAAISEILNVTGSVFDDCESKWKNLRDTFCQLLRASKNTPNGIGAVKKPKWQYYDVMYFLVPFFDTPRTISNINGQSVAPSENDVEILSDSTDNIARLPSEPKQTNSPLEEKLLSLLEKDAGKENPRQSESQLFLESLAKRMENLSVEKRSILQIKILELFHQVEFEIN